MFLKLCFLVCLLFASNKLISQNFAPLGATWHYTEKFAFTANESFFKIESTQDSLFAGKNCKLLLKNKEIDCEQRPLSVFVYEEDSVVYFWDENFNEFQILYDLKKQINQSWIVKIKELDQSIDTILVTVANSQQIIMNAISLKSLDVSYHINYNMGSQNTWNSRIIETIGDTTFMFNLISQTSEFCDYNFSGGLRCYSDSSFGLYATISAQDCAYENLNLKEKNFNNKINVYPNPSTENISLAFGLLKGVKIVQIYDLKGQLIQELETNESNYYLSLKNYAKGMYVLKCTNQQTSHHLKICKE